MARLVAMEGALRFRPSLACGLKTGLYCKMPAACLLLATEIIHANASIAIANAVREGQRRGASFIAAPPSKM